MGPTYTFFLFVLIFVTLVGNAMFDGSPLPGLEFAHFFSKQQQIK
jgi:hypothetical protein